MKSSIIIFLLIMSSKILWSYTVRNNSNRYNAFDAIAPQENLMENPDIFKAQVNLPEKIGATDLKT